MKSILASVLIAVTIGMIVTPSVAQDTKERDKKAGEAKSDGAQGPAKIVGSEDTGKGDGGDSRAVG